MALSSYDNSQSTLLIAHAWFFLITSICLNFLGLYLAIYHSHQNIGKYQSILYCFLSFNIFFSALNSFTDVQFHVSGGHNRASCSLILVGAVNLDDERTSIILIYIFVFIFIEAVLMVTGQIIHRSLIIYKIIKPENTITTAFAIFFITFCVLIIWIILFVMASITTTMCFDRSAGDGNNTLVDPNDPRCRDFRYKLMNIYDFNIATFVAIPFEIYNYDEQKLQLSLYAVMLFGFLCFLLIASICTVIVCSTLIIRKIKSSSFHLSQKNMHAEMLRTLLGQNMHAEMLRTLLGQALSPILLLQLPLLISVIAIGVEGDLWWLFFTMYFTLAWFPTIQPMILILGVASYRKRFFKILESIRGSFKCQLAIIRPKIREETISSASTMRF